MYPAPHPCIYRAWLVSEAQIGRLSPTCIHYTHAIASVHADMQQTKYVGRSVLYGSPRAGPGEHINQTRP
jgi:hypothetical protein